MKQRTSTAQKRLRILGDDEIQAIYHRPRFTYEESLEYFSLSPTELTAMEQLHSIKSRIYFILQLGYFKARQLFFVFTLKDVSEDVRYIIEQYFPNFQLTDFEITKVTRLKHQRLILKLYNYRSCDTEERQKLKTKALQAATVCGKPIYVFREIMHYLQEERIVAPGYSFLQNLVGQTLTSEQNRLIDIIRHHLTLSDIEALKSLLSDSQGLYEITLLKREPKDFSIKEMGREISRGKQIHHLYCLAQKFLPHLLISNESIRYYASLVTYYSVFRLRQLDESRCDIIKSLYLLNYIDSPPLRSNVQKALNRGENYHQLRRAVSYANFGKLRFKNEYEQQIWGECARLITNCIIYYNATILSHMLSHLETTGDNQGAEILKQVSPVAWKHINLHGRYEFSKLPEHININAIIQELIKVKQHWTG